MRVAGGIADLLGFLSLDRGEELPRAKARPAGRRMGSRPPGRPRPVDNPAKLASLIVVAAALLDSEARGAVFTFDQLVKKMRELLGRDGDLELAAIQAVLPSLIHVLVPARHGWRWKGRSGSTLLG